MGIMTTAQVLLGCISAGTRPVAAQQRHESGAVQPDQGHARNRAGFFAGIGVPVSAVTFSWATEPVPFLAAASIGSTLVVTVTLLRLYLGWSFVGNRLLSATVEYEETGWYDGQLWVKTPQVLMRDRLLSNYTVLPAMRRIRRSLLASAAACVTSVVLLQTSAHAGIVEQVSAEAQPGTSVPVSAKCDMFCCAHTAPSMLTYM